MRSDAARNRKVLVEAAAAAFAEQGSDVSVSEIAERAGIGKGTVFRHFASKEDLLATIVVEKLDALAAKGRELKTAPNPAEGLYQYMSAAIELQVQDRAFCEVVHDVRHQRPHVRASQEALETVTEALTSRARAHGAIREEITGEDITLLMSGIFQTVSPLLDTRPGLWRRYLRLAFDGIQAQTADPLPTS